MSVMTDDDVTRLMPSVEKVARGFARNYPGCEMDDIAQEIWVHLATYWGSFAKANDIDGMVINAAQKIAFGYCQGEVLDFELHSAQYIYTNKDVRSLFEEVYFEPSAWETVPGPEVKSLCVTDSNGVTVALWDLREVFDSLSETDQVYIIRAYHQQESLDATGRKAVQRAIDKVVIGLNRKVPRRKRTDNFDAVRPKSRPTNSNAQSMVNI